MQVDLGVVLFLHAYGIEKWVLVVVKQLFFRFIDIVAEYNLKLTHQLVHFEVVQLGFFIGFLLHFFCFKQKFFLNLLYFNNLLF